MIDKTEWKTKNPLFFEYDSKNKAVDIFIREDKRCPFPFHKEDWYHQGHYLKDFIIMLNQFFKKHNLSYKVIKNE